MPTPKQTIEKSFLFPHQTLRFKLPPLIPSISILLLQHLSRPIRAPLQQLNLADCELMEVPDFGILPSKPHFSLHPLKKPITNSVLPFFPDLLVLNISHNDLSEVNPHQFSTFCSLKIIDINSTRMAPCTCQLVSMYLRRRSIEMKNGLSCESITEGGKPIKHFQSTRNELNKNLDFI